MKYLLFFIIPALLLVSSCSSESDTPIIISGGQGGGGGSTEPLEGIETISGVCEITGKPDVLEVVTWNIEFFPKRDGQTIDYAAGLIKEWDADIIAVQEITSSSSFLELADALPGWEAVLNSGGSLGLGYLYKTSEVTVVSTYELFDGDSWEFPRPPLVVKIQYGASSEAYLINLHLKCCGGSQNVERRRLASELLKGYIDTSLPGEEVIVLGDYNDDILDIEGTTPFENFVLDDLRYAFVDVDIAKGSEDYWSYPSWPSHLDHILISDELFTKATTTMTVLVDECHANYDYNVSDHRPVAVTITKN